MIIQHRIIIGLVLIFSIFLVVGNYYIYQQQRTSHIAKYKQAKQTEINILLKMANESLISENYAYIEWFFSRWGEEHKTVVSLSLKNADGFFLSQYQRQTETTTELLTVTDIITLNYKSYIISLISDLSEINELLAQLLSQLILISSIAIISLAILVWVLFYYFAITPLQNEVEQRKKAEKKFSLLLNSTAEAIYGIDTEGKCTFVNHACLNILRYDREEDVIDQNMHELIHHTKSDGSHNSLENCRIYQAFRKDEGTHVDDEILWRKDGTSFPVEYWSYPIHQSHKVIGAVVTFVDITERKYADHEKEKLIHDMSERMKELQCLFTITESIRKHLNLNEIFSDTISAISLGWLYPKDMKARIILDDKEYTDSAFKLTQWKLASPLIINNVIRGAVEVYYMKEFSELDEGPFFIQERNLIDSISKLLSTAIEHNRAEAELERLIAEEVQRSKRYGHSMSVFLLDLDHFKQVNDTYGHKSGDIVLRSFSTILHQSIRKTDYVARYGGEEFIIILPETTLIKAEELAERLCCTIAEHLIPINDDKMLKVSSSIGVASYPEHGQSWEDIIKASDSAMYTAKNDGRNQVKIANYQNF